MERIKYSTILTFILFFSLLAFVVLVLIPKYQTVLKLRVNISEWEKAIEEQREYFNYLNEDLERIKEYKNQMEKISLAIPLEPSLPNFFHLVENLALANGLSLKEVGTFSISQSKEIPSLKEAETSFILTGPYPAFKNFISDLEKSARLVKIENISFKIIPAGKTIAEGVNEFSFRVKFYSF